MIFHYGQTEKNTYHKHGRTSSAGSSPLWLGRQGRHWERELGRGGRGWPGTHSQGGWGAGGTSWS